METLKLLTKILEHQNKDIYSLDIKRGGLCYKLENYIYKKKDIGYDISNDPSITGVKSKLENAYLDTCTGDIHLIAKDKDINMYIILLKKSIEAININFIDKTIEVYSKGIMTKGMMKCDQ